MAQTSAETRQKIERLGRRRKHARKAILTAGTRPRLIVYRSNRHIYAALRDDKVGRTVTSCSSISPVIADKVKAAAGKIAEAKLVGELIAQLAKGKGITAVSFDRNGRKYHGRVKALAEGARAGGLQF